MSKIIVRRRDGRYFYEEVHSWAAANYFSDHPCDFPSPHIIHHDVDTLLPQLEGVGLLELYVESREIWIDCKTGPNGEYTYLEESMEKRLYIHENDGFRWADPYYNVLSGYLATFKTDRDAFLILLRHDFFRGPHDNLYS